MGGAFGGALNAVTGLGKSLWSPDSANDLDLKRLLDSGVMPSIGQATGKNWINSLEQKMTVIPWLGDAIRDMRDRGLNTWNMATMNEALKPSGYKVNEGGHEGIQQMKDAVEKAYDWAVGGVGNIPADAQHIIRTADIDNSINRLNSKADLITMYCFIIR
jgi:hypothetical protein